MHAWKTLAALIEGCRRNEVTAGIDESSRGRRGKWDEDREVRRWMIPRLSMSRDRPEMTRHGLPFGSGKGRVRESNNSTPGANRNAAVTSPRHRAYKGEESHTRGSKDLEKPSYSPPSIKRPSQSRISPDAPIKLRLILLLLLLRLLPLPFGLSRGSRPISPSSQDF